jgi:hypothetical protein
MSRNPLHITYTDLVKDATERLTYMEREYRIRVNQGSMTSWTATRKIEMQKRLVRLLKKYEQNQQIDLFVELEKMKG